MVGEEENGFGEDSSGVENTRPGSAEVRDALGFVDFGRTVKRLRALDFGRVNRARWFGTDCFLIFFRT